MISGPEPWEPGSGPVASARRYAPATKRNRESIVAVLREELPSSGLVLEVASGSGEHAIHFAAAFPDLHWQPSDPDPDALASIEAWRAEAGLLNLRPPIRLDARGGWPADRVDAILCINMVHISPWAATLGLMKGAGRVLPPHGLLYLYGPYVRDGVETAPSNLAFDVSLRARDPQWGLRRMEDVIAVAHAEGLAFQRLVEMPANNLSLTFRRQD